MVGAHHGIRPVEQGEGDSFVIAFSRASDAVACALALQRAPLAPLRLRIGVHTGEVQLRDENNYVGPAINRTARLRELAHGGQTVLSGTTGDLVADTLADGAWLNDLGIHALRICRGRSGLCSCAIPTSATNFRPFDTANPLSLSAFPHN